MFPVILAVSLFSFNPFANQAQSTSTGQVLARHEISLEKRYANREVNKVFKDNILLTLSYMDDKVKHADSITWDGVEKPATYDFTLQPHETFAFHDALLKEFQSKVTKTTNAHFSADEGFLSDGYLYGDGVCHLASLMYWGAKDAKLSAVAPTPHDFAPVPEIPKQYGVAILSQKYDSISSEEQNLYITNTLEKPVTFTFDYAHKNLELTVTEG